MHVTRTITERIGDIVQTETTSLVIGSIDFANEANHMRRLDSLIDHTFAAGTLARHKDEWTPDLGPVLWWSSPIIEQPYVGTPDDALFPAYVTHWTPIERPRNLTDHT